MRFTVLGSGTVIPDPLRGPAGFLLEHGDRAWLIDGGTGTLRRCSEAGVDPRQLAGGFYSHRHPDHCADLMPLLFAMHVGQREADYPIWAGPGFADYLAGLKALYGSWIAPGAGEVVLTELTDAPVHIGPELVVRSRLANHSAGALHLRFELGGKAIVFSGDTGPSPALAELASGCDLLVCECGAAEDHPFEGHLRPSEVRDIVAAAQPKQVWLTHLYPNVDPASAIACVAQAGCRVRHAADLDVWEHT